MTDREKLKNIGREKIWGGLSATPYIDDIISGIMSECNKDTIHNEDDPKKEVESHFEVGDNVWHIRYGWGKVVEIKKGEVYSICVQFKRAILCFTEDGKAFKSDLNRTIFFEEIPIPETAVKRPKWRADFDGWYYFINSFGDVDKSNDTRWPSDDSRWEICNYFKTEEDAKSSDIYKAFRGGKR